MKEALKPLEIKTLEAVDTLGNACAGDLAKALNIMPSTFTNRAKPLVEKSLIKKTSYGKERRYSLTELGKTFLEVNKNMDNVTDNLKLIDTLTELLVKSLDDTYYLIDLFFSAPLCSLTKHYMHGSLKIDPRNPLISELWRNLTDCICTASYQKFTKDQFSSFLNISGNHSPEVKGLIYYIANKYNEFKE